MRQSGSVRNGAVLRNPLHWRVFFPSARIGYKPYGRFVGHEQPDVPVFVVIQELPIPLGTKVPGPDNRSPIDGGFVVNPLAVGGMSRPIAHDDEMASSLGLQPR